MSEMDFNAQQLIEYAADPQRFSQTQRKAIEAFAARNAAAAQTIRLYRLAQSRTAEDDSIPPSLAAIERAKANFAHHADATPSPSILDAVHELLARLMYDSRVQPAAVRSTGVQDQILLTYETELGEIEFQARRSIDHAGETRWKILGQTSGELAKTAQRIELQSIETEETIASAKFSREAVFELETTNVRFSMVVYTRTAKVTVSPIELE